MTSEQTGSHLTPEKEASKLQFLWRQFCGPPPPISPGDVDLTGRTAVVTGANGGLGVECCRQLLDLGLSKLILTARDSAKGDATVKAITSSKSLRDGQTVEAWHLDYSSYDSITAFAERVENLTPRVDIAILNAGVNRGYFSINPSTGHEDDLQTNYLSTILLALLMLRSFSKQKAASPSDFTPGRIVVVSSDTAAWTPFNERHSTGSLLKAYDDESKFDKLDHYASTKLLGQLFVTELAKRVPSSLAVINCCNPGLCHGSTLPKELGVGAAVFIRLIGRTTSVGARTLVHAAAKQDEKSHGRYVEDGELRPMSPHVYSKEAEEVTKRLWDETLEELSFAGVKDIIQVASQG